MGVRIAPSGNDFGRESASEGFELGSRSAAVPTRRQRLDGWCWLDLTQSGALLSLRNPARLSGARISVREILLQGSRILVEMIVALFTDGGCIGRNPSKLGGTWAWCGIDEQDQHVWSDSGVLKTQPNLKLVTNNHMEQIAIVKALEAMPDGWSGTLYSDSQLALGRMFERWKTRNLPKSVSRRGQVVLQRMGEIKTVLLNGHPTKAQLACGIGHGGLPTSKWNVWCDAECNRRKNDQTIYR